MRVSRKVRKLSKRGLLSVIVTIAIAAQSFAVNAISVKASEKAVPFQMQIICNSSEQFSGDFLLSGEKIYIKDNTLEKITGISYEVLENHTVYDGVYRLGKVNAWIPLSEVIVTENGRYLSLTRAFAELGLNGSLGDDAKALVVVQLPSVRELEPTLLEIYQNTGYGMTYWRDDYFFELSKSCAVVADMIKNFRYISYQKDVAQKNQYKEAIWNIIIPLDDADYLFYMETSEVSELLADCKEWTDKLGKRLGEEDGGFFGDYGTIIKKLNDVKDKAQIDEIVKVATFIRNMGEAEESCIRGLEIVMGEESNQNENMCWAGEYVLSTYYQNTPMWYACIEEFAGGMYEDISEDVMKLLVDDFWTDLANGMTNAILGTQEQVDASLIAIANMEIQKECKTCFQSVRLKYNGSMNWNKRIIHLGDMRDIMVVYLKACREAHKAVGIEDELEASSQSMISSINEDLEKIMQYPRKCFTVYEDAILLQDVLLNCVEQLIEQSPGGNLETAEGTATIDITWKPSAKIELMISGTMNDGSNIYCENYNYYAENGELIATATHADNGIALEVYRTDCVLRFEISNGEEWATKGTHIRNTGLKIHVDASGNVSEDITTGNSDYLVRSYTGLWFMSFQLNNGEVEYYDPFS